jgi:hypothetical protein
MTAKPPTLAPGDRVLVVGQPEPTRNGVHVLGFIESDEPPEVDENGNPRDQESLRQLVLMSPQWQALASRCDVFAITIVGPIDLSSVDTADLDAVQHWATSAAHTPLPRIIRDYFARVDAAKHQGST